MHGRSAAKQYKKLYEKNKTLKFLWGQHDPKGAQPRTRNVVCVVGCCGWLIDGVCLFVCLFVRSFVRLFVCLLVCLFVCLFVCLLVCLLVSLLVCFNVVLCFVLILVCLHASFCSLLPHLDWRPIYIYTWHIYYIHIYICALRFSTTLSYDIEELPFFFNVGILFGVCSLRCNFFDLMTCSLDYGGKQRTKAHSNRANQKSYWHHIDMYHKHINVLEKTCMV